MIFVAVFPFLSIALIVACVLWKLFGITPDNSILFVEGLYLKGFAKFSTTIGLASLSPIPLALSCASMEILLGNPSALVSITESGAVIVGLILSTIATGIVTVFITVFPRRISISLRCVPCADVSTEEPPFQRIVKSVAGAVPFESVI